MTKVWILDWKCMMSRVRLFAVLAVVAGFTSCARVDEGFTLPAGNAERGQAAFLKFRCFDCHYVPGVDLPPGEEPDQVMVKLGGEVTEAKTYGDLVTGVINPSHRLAKAYAATVAEDGESRMPVYNDFMTVTELIDIVTFLQEHYELKRQEPTPYQDYYMP